ncbi:MAG: alpha-2-macroglobulin [Polyangiaceae bacterium]|nr:alpha-2-macroglobulin [Polyangiaceae bacterium]
MKPNTSLRLACLQGSPMAALLAALLAVGAGTIGCGSGDANNAGPDTETGGNGTGGSGTGGTTEPDTVDGEPDSVTNGSIRVDEAKVLGSASGTKLALKVPVREVGGGKASGTLSVSLVGVDGKETVSSAQVDYDLAKGADDELEAKLTLPSEIEKQADLSVYNVRITADKDARIRITRSLMHVLPPYEVRVDGPARIKLGRQATYRVQTRDAISRAPLAAYPVKLAIQQDDEAVQSLDKKSDETGVATFDVSLDQTGSYELSAATMAEATEAQVSRTLQVEEVGAKVLLTTDKPIYQPGQNVYFRTLTLMPPANEPVAKESVLLELEDGKGNKIMKRTLKSDSYGIAATRFQLGSVLNMGTFKVRATVDGHPTERTVEVARYALPKFRVSITPDQSWYSPGETLQAAVDAGYFFGKPVADADVLVEASTLDIGETVFRQVQGKTNADGVFDFSVQLPSSLVGLPLEQGKALVNLRVTTTDAAGQEVVQEQLVTLAQNAVDLSIVPEAGQLVPGVDNVLLIFASDPQGAPLAETQVVLSDGQTELSAETDEYGQAEVSWKPTDVASLTATATPPDGKPVSQSFTFNLQTGGEHVIVRTDRSVYRIGDSVQVEVVSSADSPLVYVDWINDGQTVDMRTLQAEDGSAHFTAPLDATLVGSNRIEAYVVDEDGNIVRAGRSFFARNASSLKIDLATDKKQYEPGESAELTFSVEDDQGDPAVAALGVQVVDEAIYALIDAKPGLLKTHFELEDAYAEPQYEIHPPQGDLSDLLFEQTAANDKDQAAAAQQRTEAVLASVGGTSITGLQASSWPDVITDAKGQLSTYLQAEGQRLAKEFAPVVTEEGQKLEASGCTASSYYCSSIDEYYATALSEAVRARVQAYDFWGNLYTTAAGSYDQLMVLTSAGPDERTGTGDEVIVTIAWSDLGVDVQSFVPTRGGELEDADGAVPGNWAASGGAAAVGPEGMGAATGTGTATGSTQSGTGEEPRVRKDFPETLFVDPAVITGPDGKATIEVPLADSITEWRVTAMANSQSGKLGSLEGGVTVFQDFFVDIDFPATLTRGDEVSFPIAVYNYLDAEQTVSLELESADWYTPLGATSRSLTLAPGEVTGVRFPVRVEEVGVGTLTVRAYGQSRSDAVARTVRVIPDGKAMPTARSGSLKPGETTLAASFPETAIPGSEELYLNVYPAYLSQVVEGMDSMLQEPTGCFEQTTSSTWPNVLVTDYMQATGQITTEIQMKAESLISTGYQRLLTFEHPGGGYSWFGTQDGGPNLSVTAFGLMEFVDMAKVHDVDEAMITRTRDWLVEQQSADGSWPGGQTEFFSFHTSTVRNTAFVVWSLATAGTTGSAMDRGITYIKGALDLDSEDAYTLGMVANALAIAAPSDALLGQILEHLDSTKKTDGDKVSWDTGETQTCFYSQGADADMNATALVAHAMLLAGGYGSTVNAALQYLASNKGALGNYGSTQATIWTLRTLLLAASKGTEGAVGSLQVDVDGEAFTTVELTEAQSDVMTTVDLGARATTGDHDVRLTFVGTGQVSYNLVASHNIPWTEVSEPAGPLGVSISYDKTTLYVNETATATVSVENVAGNTTNMVLVTIGIPPGFGVVTEDLDEYVAAGTLSHYETTGKQLNLYLTQLAAAKVQRISYRISAIMPVKAADGGAVVYPYYQPDQKTTAASTTLEAVEP